MFLRVPNGTTGLPQRAKKPVTSEYITIDHRSQITETTIKTTYGCNRNCQCEQDVRLVSVQVTISSGGSPARHTEERLGNLEGYDLPKKKPRL